jgi:hypothetical protein
MTPIWPNAQAILAGMSVQTTAESPAHSLPWSQFYSHRSVWLTEPELNPLENMADARQFPTWE